MPKPNPDPTKRVQRSALATELARAGLRKAAARGAAAGAVGGVAASAVPLALVPGFGALFVPALAGYGAASGAIVGAYGALDNARYRAFKMAGLGRYPALLDESLVPYRSYRELARAVFNQRDVVARPVSARDPQTRVCIGGTPLESDRHFYRVSSGPLHQRGLFFSRRVLDRDTLHGAPEDIRLSTNPEKCIFRNEAGEIFVAYPHVAEIGEYDLARAREKSRDFPQKKAYETAVLQAQKKLLTPIEGLPTLQPVPGLERGGERPTEFFIPNRVIVPARPLPAGLAPVMHDAVKAAVVNALARQIATSGAPDESGQTPLAAAIHNAGMPSWGRLAIVQELLAAGADPNTPSGRSGPPLVAAMYATGMNADERRAIVKALLRAGAKPDLPYRHHGRGLTNPIEVARFATSMLPQEQGIMLDILRRAPPPVLGRQEAFQRLLGPILLQADCKNFLGHVNHLEKEEPGATNSLLTLLQGMLKNPPVGTIERMRPTLIALSQNKEILKEAAKMAGIQPGCRNQPEQSWAEMAANIGVLSALTQEPFDPRKVIHAAGQAAAHEAVLSFAEQEQGQRRLVGQGVEVELGVALLALVNQALPPAHRLPGVPHPDHVYAFQTVVPIFQRNPGLVKEATALAISALHPDRAVDNLVGGASLTIQTLWQDACERHFPQRYAAVIATAEAASETLTERGADEADWGALNEWRKEKVARITRAITWGIAHPAGTPQPPEPSFDTAWKARLATLREFEGENSTRIAPAIRTINGLLAEAAAAAGTQRGASGNPSQGGLPRSLLGALLLSKLSSRLARPDEAPAERVLRYPRNGSWTRSSGCLASPMARRDDAAG